MCSLQHNQTQLTDLGMVQILPHSVPAARGGLPSRLVADHNRRAETYSSLLDIVPSALESKGSEDAAMYTNHNLYGMLKAMSAHKSQFRW